MARLGIKDFDRGEKINNLQEFKDDIEMGIDQNIFIGDTLFWLGAGKNDTHVIGQCPDGALYTFKDAEDMLNHFVFNGKPLKEWIIDGATVYANE